MRIPWSDLKVAYDLNNPSRFWSAWERGKVALPEGWDFIESDCSGARCVAVFRVEGVPTVEDGYAVAAQLRRWGS